MRNYKENFELLQSAPELDINVTEVINQTTGETSAEPIPGKSGTQNRGIDFLLSNFKPFLKTPPRKQSSRGERKRKCAVLTDTPEKEALEKEYEEKLNKKEKQEKKGKGKGQVKGTGQKENEKIKMMKMLRDDTDSEAEEWFCLACGGEYSKSDEEEFYPCLVCKMWSHVNV